MLDVFQLHPYEYVYFNRVFGGLASAQNQYETEYWGLSLRAGMEWINDASGGTENVVFTGSFMSAAPFADENVRLIFYNDFEEAGIDPPFYYIAVPRWDLHEKFPDCDVVYSVVKQTVPLTTVKRCE